jgi:hypothetical protein
MWFAVGGSNNSGGIRSIATSTDGANFTLIDQVVFEYGICYNIVFNGSKYIAVGFGYYPTATSPDGINWTTNTQLASKNPGSSNLQNATCIYYDGSQYIIGLQKTNDSNGDQYDSFVTSPDGITWDTSVRRVLTSCVVTAIAYNGTTYVITGTFRGNGSETILYYRSDNFLNFNPINNDFLSRSVSDVEWNGTYFVVCGGRRSADLTATIIYSEDGKNWFPSDNNEYTGANGTTSITY